MNAFVTTRQRYSRTPRTSITRLQASFIEFQPVTHSKAPRTSLTSSSFAFEYKFPRSIDASVCSLSIVTETVLQS